MSPYIHIYLFILQSVRAAHKWTTSTWSGEGVLTFKNLALPLRPATFPFFSFCSRTMFRLHKNQPLIPNCITNHQSFILPQLLVTCMICTLIWKQPTSYGLPLCLYSCVLPCCLVALTENDRTKAQQIITLPAAKHGEPSSSYFSSFFRFIQIPPSERGMISSWSEKAMLYYYLSKPAIVPFCLPSVEGEPSLVYEFVSFFAPSFN